MDFKDIYVKNDSKKFIYDNNVIITFTTIPERLISNKFEKFIKNIVKFDFKIICSITEYEKYETKISKEDFLNKIYHLRKTYKINFVYDDNNEPINKILSIAKLKLSLKIKDSDIIIVINDNMIYSNLDYHVVGHEIYMCDCIGIDEKFLIKKWNSNSNRYEFNKSKTLFENNYKGFFYGWLSYSCRFHVLNNLNDFYQKLLKINSDIKYHDDLIISLYFHFMNSNTIQLKLNTIEEKNSGLFKNNQFLKNKINEEELKKELFQKLKYENNFLIHKTSNQIFNKYITKKINYDFIYKHNILSNENYSIVFYKYDKIIMTIGNIKNKIDLIYFDDHIHIDNINSTKVSMIVDDYKFISRNKTQKNNSTNIETNIDYLICSKFQHNKINTKTNDILNFNYDQD